MITRSGLAKAGIDRLRKAMSRYRIKHLGPEEPKAEIILID